TRHRPGRLHQSEVDGMTLAAHEEVIEPEIVRDASEWAEVIKDDLGRAVEGIVSAGKHLIAAKADVSHGEWLPMLKEIGISRSYAFKLMSIGERLSNVSHEKHLPGNITVLYELSRLDPSDIEDGIESGAITPDMKIKDAKSFARSEWPVVPEPTPEERIQKFEDTRERLINEGYLPKPRTEEERKADAKEFVESLIGKTKRQAPPATPEDQFAKALNAVGAAIKTNHGVNEALLNEDGWNVLRALGLR